jgi:hypothetical protein
LELNTYYEGVCYSIFPPTPTLTLIYYEGVFYFVFPPTPTLIYEGPGGGKYRVKHTLITCFTLYSPTTPSLIYGGGGGGRGKYRVKHILIIYESWGGGNIE